MHSKYSTAALLLTGAALFTSASTCRAQAVATQYQANYTLVSLGFPVDVPGPLGGVVFLDRNTLLVGGAANGGAGALYAVPLTRDGGGNIVGFAGPGTFYAPAPGIDGGLFYFPNGGIGFMQWPVHLLGYIRPFTNVVSQTTDLTPFLAGSVGTGTVIPPGFPNQGRLLIGSYGSSQWVVVNFVDSTTAPTTYDFQTPVVAGPVSAGSGPEGVIYVPTNSPQFATRTMLICEYSAGKVSAFDVDGSGLPVPASQRDFVVGLSGAEGGVLDPFSGQFVFSTFGGGGVVVVRGFGSPTAVTRCQPADIADDAGDVIPSFGVNSGVNEGDYNGFFNNFFSANTVCDIAYDNGTPRPPFGAATGVNNGVNEGDYNCFFANFFNGCP
ncbi:hypothetical protein BH11PLA1_BH11PLA1_02530 [soil metagenome]